VDGKEDVEVRISFFQARDLSRKCSPSHFK